MHLDVGSFETCVTFAPYPSLLPSLCGKIFFLTLTFLIILAVCIWFRTPS